MKTRLRLLTGLLCACFLSAASCQVADSSAVSNESFRTIAAGKNVVILDVRTAEEYAAGYIPGATNIDVLKTESFRSHISTLDKSKTYLLYCRSGKRSATALSLMKDAGFTEVKHLANGIAGWDGAVIK